MDIFYPLQLFANWVTYSIFLIDKTSQLGESSSFFIYDTLKIFILLFIIAWVMGLVNAHFPVEKVRKYLTTKKLYGADYLLAALFGTITPFCSCSSVPLFIGFVRGGIPLGVTLTFLISSPLVDSVVVAMLMGVFGFKTTIIYVVSGIVVSMIAGYILGKMSLEKYLSPWVLKSTEQTDNNITPQTNKNFTEKIKIAFSESLDIIKTVGLYVVLGVGIGAFIHGFVPVSFFETYLNINSLIAVPIAVLVAVPLYANAAGILPIAQVLVDKGIPLGTVLAFMMAAVGLSISSAVILKKVMTGKLIVIFYGVVTICVILLGYIYILVL
jgi:uncharacterized membrane protein YraQ (UPF0718 family)